MLFPALNCVGAAFGKPIAAQTASVGVSTTQVPREGNIIRDNLAWTFASLGYVLLVAVLFALFVPYVMGQVTTPFTDRDVAPTMGRSGGSGRDREGTAVARRRKRRLGLFDLIMLLIVAAVVWLFLGQAGIVPPLPIGP